MTHKDERDSTPEKYIINVNYFSHFWPLLLTAANTNLLDWLCSVCGPCWLAGWRRGGCNSTRKRAQHEDDELPAYHQHVPACLTRLYSCPMAAAAITAAHTQRRAKPSAKVRDKLSSLMVQDLYLCAMSDITTEPRVLIVALLHSGPFPVVRGCISCYCWRISVAELGLCLEYRAP